MNNDKDNATLYAELEAERFMTDQISLLHEAEDLADGLRHYKDINNGENHSKYTIRLKHASGMPLICEVSGTLIDWDGEPAVLNFISDVTLRVRQEQEIKFIAQHDQLTKLPNRSLLEDRLSLAIAAAERRHG